MAQLLRVTVLAAVMAGVAVCCSPVSAQGQARGGQAGGPRQGYRSYYRLPGYWSLQSEAVRKELKLTKQQQAKLDEISKKYGEQMQLGSNREEWAKYAKLPREERNKKYAELNEKRRQQAAELTKQIEALLTPSQLEALKMVELRRRGVPYLTNERMAEALGLTEEQQEKLRKNRQELTEATQKLQRESAKKALDNLTPEQLEKLKKLHAEGYRAIWKRPQTPPKSK